MHDWSLLQLQIASRPFSFGHLPPLKALPIDLLWWHLSWIGYMYFNFLEMHPQKKAVSLFLSQAISFPWKRAKIRRRKQILPDYSQSSSGLFFSYEARIFLSLY